MWCLNPFKSNGSREYNPEGYAQGKLSLTTSKEDNALYEIRLPISECIYNMNLLEPQANEIVLKSFYLMVFGFFIPPIAIYNICLNWKSSRPQEAQLYAQASFVSTVIWALFITLVILRFTVLVEY